MCRHSCRFFACVMESWLVDAICYLERQKRLEVMGKGHGPAESTVRNCTLLDRIIRMVSDREVKVKAKAMELEKRKKELITELEVTKLAWTKCNDGLAAVNEELKQLRE